MWSLLPAPALRGAYRAQQASLLVSLVGVHGLLRRLEAFSARVSKQNQRALRREYEALLERDLHNALAGLYPRELLFQLPLRSYAAAVPRFVLDLPRAWLRSRGASLHRFG